MSGRPANKKKGAPKGVMKHNNQKGFKGKRSRFSKQRGNGRHGGNKNISQDSMKDKRFANVFNDPRFTEAANEDEFGNSLNTGNNKIKIDNRFKELLTNPAFQNSYRIDKYGRQIDDTSNDFSQFYELEEDNKNENNNNNGKKNENEDGYEGETENTTQKQKSGNNETNKNKKKRKKKKKSNQNNENKTNLSRAQKRIAKEFKAEQKEKEFNSDDPDWDIWDKSNENDDNENDNENSNENENENKLSKEELSLLNRETGTMFDYNPSSTDSSDNDNSNESDFNYDKLGKEEIGEDARAILEFKNEDDDNLSDVEPTKRLAIVNLDWDNIRSTDIYVVLRSFLPSQGSINRVAIYPSEYGVKQMEHESKYGPNKELWDDNDAANNDNNKGKSKDDNNAIDNFLDDDDYEYENEYENENENENENDNIQSRKVGKINDSDSSDDNENELYYDSDELDQLKMEQEKIERIKETISAIKSGQIGDIIEDSKRDMYNKQSLRKYELQKLKYYYAIVECDSINTADRLYQECDGREFQTTCNIMDLRFVDNSFEPPFAPRDECTDMPENYIPAPNNQTNCLGSTFVELTWDQTDPKRKELTEKIFTNDELLKMDLSSYLAGDDEITDAAFETDYPVTEYDTDTPNKKVKIKRRARNRYKDILQEFEALEKNVKIAAKSDKKNVLLSSSDDDDDDESDSDSGNDNKDNKNKNKSKDDIELNDSDKEEERKKAVEAAIHSEFLNDNSIENAKIKELERIQNVRISSDDEDDDDDDSDENENENESEIEDSDIDTSSKMKLKKNSKYDDEDVKALKKLQELDDEDDDIDIDIGDKIKSKPSKLNDWIDKQQSISMFERDIKQLNAKKEKLNEIRAKMNDSDNDDDVDKVSVISDIDNEKNYGYNEVLSSDDESLLDDNDPNVAYYMKNDPYFKQEMLNDSDDSDDNDNGEPAKKRRKLNNDNENENSNEKSNENKEENAQKKAEKRAALELLLMSNNTNDNDNGNDNNNNNNNEKMIDPEMLEYDKEAMSQLTSKFNKRLNRDWRLRRAIKHQVKKKLEEMDNFQFNKQDTRFSALYQDPDFALDPTSNQYKSTVTNDTIMKQTRTARLMAQTRNENDNQNRNNDNSNDNDNGNYKSNKGKKKNKSNETKNLIQSLKMKSKLIPELQDGNKQRNKINEFLQKRKQTND